MKILVVTKNWLGDILFEIPAIEMLRRNFPQAEIICMTHPRCREILQNHPAVDRVLEFDERGQHRPLTAKIRWVRQLRKEKMDKAYFFHRSRTRAFLLWLSGIPERIGYASKTFHFLSQAFSEPEKPLHHVDFFIHLLTQTGIPKPENPSYSFYSSAQEEQSADRILEEKKLQKYVCFHLGANWEPKRWPTEHFAHLADLIHDQWGLPMVLTGGPGDLPLGEQVLVKVQRAKVISLIGETSLGELAAIFKRSYFVVSGDSGPMHIASGVGARVLAVFGPTQPEFTGPRGIAEQVVLSFVPKGYTAPWYGDHFPEGGWLSQITPEEVFKALENKNWGNPQPIKKAQSLSEFRTSEPKKILLNTLSNIGDVILTTPVLMSLAAGYPGSEITVIVGPRAKGILEGSAYIHELVVYDKHARFAEKIEFVKKLRRKKYDIAVDLKNSAVPFLVSAKKRSPLFRRFKQIAARKRHLEVLEWMGLGVSEIPVFDFFNAQEWEKLRNKLVAQKVSFEEDYVAMAPVAASDVKTWSGEFYQQLIRKILEKTSLKVLLLGGPQDKEKIEKIAAENPGRVFNFAGQTTLREMAAVIGHSQLLVANDSSAAQLGFEMNHPTVVIFGPTDPKKFAREGSLFRVVREEIACSPCEKAQCRFERQACLLDLTPEKVFKACQDLLEKPRANAFFSAGIRKG